MKHLKTVAIVAGVAAVLYFAYKKLSGSSTTFGASAETTVKRNGFGANTNVIVSAEHPVPPITVPTIATGDPQLV